MINTPLDSSFIEKYNFIKLKCKFYCIEAGFGSDISISHIDNEIVRFTALERTEHGMTMTGHALPLKFFNDHMGYLEDMTSIAETNVNLIIGRFKATEQN